jgi:hypothetical protein
MVVAVIFILLGITFGITRGVQNARARAEAKAELAVISQAIEQFKARYGDYPWHDSNDDEYPSSSGEVTSTMLLYALTGRLAMEPDTDGSMAVRKVDNELDDADVQGKAKFLDHTKFVYSGTENAPEALLDPWGNPYIYWYKWENSPDSWDVFGFHLYCTGPNGTDANDALKEKIDETTGVISTDFREVADREGIIFVGE